MSEKEERLWRWAGPAACVICWVGCMWFVGSSPQYRVFAESKGAPCKAGDPQLCVPIRDADQARYKQIQTEAQAASNEVRAAQNWLESLRQEQETIRLRACLAAGLADIECGGFVGDKVGVNQNPIDGKKK
jgi:hypothetical protein